MAGGNVIVRTGPEQQKPVAEKQTEWQAKCVEIIKKWDPAGAFAMGFDECAGRAFIHSKANIDAALNDMRTLRNGMKEKGANEPSVSRFLDSFEFHLTHIEPYNSLHEATGLLQVWLAKEGSSPEFKQHVVSYFRELREDLREMRKLFKEKDVPVPMRIVVYEMANEVLGFFKPIKEAANNDAGVCKELETTRRAIASFRHGISGLKFAEFRHEGYDKWVPLMRSFPSESMGRERWHAENLKTSWCYPYSPEQILQIANAALEKEIPVFKAACRRLAEAYGLDPETATPLDLKKKGGEKSRLKPAEFIPFINGLVPVLYPVIQERITDVAPQHVPELKETPPYLRASIPFAAVCPFDLLKEKPHAITFMTPQKEPPSVYDILFILSHEGGHDVHVINSAVDLANTGSTALDRYMAQYGNYTYVLTEGIAHRREAELLGVIDGILSKDEALLNANERALKGYLAQYADLPQLKVECEFALSFYKVVRQIRAIADPSINMGWKTYPQLLDECEKATGIPQKVIFNWTWNFMSMPGYSESYFIAKHVVEQLQNAAEAKGIPMRNVNTYISSLGLIPLDIAIQRTEEHFGISSGIHFQAAAQA